MSVNCPRLSERRALWRAWVALCSVLALLAFVSTPSVAIAATYLGGLQQAANVASSNPAPGIAGAAAPTRAAAPAAPATAHAFPREGEPFNHFAFCDPGDELEPDEVLEGEAPEEGPDKRLGSSKRALPFIKGTSTCLSPHAHEHAAIAFRLSAFPARAPPEL